MKILPNEELQRLLEAGYETRNLEFREAFIWGEKSTKYLQERLLRSLLGLANTRDGGWIVLGVKEENKKFILEGCESTALSSFSYDRVKERVDGFADQGITFDIFRGTHLEKEYIILKVAEFEEFPIICKNHGTAVMQDGSKANQLTKGAIYIRSLKDKPSTIQVTEKEMREVVERAVDKSHIRLLKRGWIRRDNDEDIFSRMRGDF